MPRVQTEVTRPKIGLAPVENKFLMFGKPDISEADISAVVEVLRGGWIGTGPVARKLEEEFSAYLGGGYTLAVSSCTMGLMLALRVSNVGQGKEVITTPLTFAATVNAIVAMGAKPVFVDVDPLGCLDPEKIRFALTEKTGAVLPVHYTGAACDMGKIMANAESYGLTVIEDAAHAFGGEYIARSNSDKPALPRKLGTIGHFGVFSLYATKNITAAEGGVIHCRRGDLLERMRILSNQGQTSGAWGRYGTGPIAPYEIAHDGYKGNLPDLLAALGLSQLRRWPEIQEKRTRVWRIYEERLGLKEQGHSQHLFTVRVKNRDQLRQKLWEMGIGTGVHYRPLHLEPGFKYLGYKEGDFPVAEKIGAETLSLPVSATMDEDDANRVADVVSRLKEAV